jgi:hypothetical protein
MKEKEKLKKLTLEIKVLDSKRKEDKDLYPKFTDFISEVFDGLQKMRFYGEDEKCFSIPQLTNSLVTEIDKDEIITSVDDNRENKRSLEDLIHHYATERGINISPLIKKIVRGERITDDDCTFTIATATSKITFDYKLENEVLTPSEGDDV